MICKLEAAMHCKATQCCAMHFAYGHYITYFKQMYTYSNAMAITHLEP